MKQNRAISPSRNDQWSGKTLRRASGRARRRPVRSSSQPTSRSSSVGRGPTRPGAVRRQAPRRSGGCRPVGVVRPWDHHEVMFQNAGPTGSGKSPSAVNVPSSAIADRQLRQRLARPGPTMGAAPVEDVERRLVAGADEVLFATRGRGPPGSLRACTPSNRRRSRPGAPARRSGSSRSSPVATRMRSVCALAEPGSPSGNTVVMLPTGRSAARTAMPLMSTNRLPGAQLVVNSSRPGAGPSDRAGMARAAPRPAEGAEQHPDEHPPAGEPGLLVEDLAEGRVVRARCEGMALFDRDRRVHQVFWPR